MSFSRNKVDRIPAERRDRRQHAADSSREPNGERPAFGVAKPAPTTGFNAYANGTVVHAHAAQLPPKVVGRR